MTNTLVNFGKFYNIILYPLFLLREKCSMKKNQRKKAISSENAVREEQAIPICLGDKNKNLGESVGWELDKTEQIQFFD